MRHYLVAVSLAVLLGFTLLACTSSNNGGSMVTSRSAVPVAFSIHDNPPMGVNILSFKITLSASTLQPADAMQQPVNMLRDSDDVELIHLQSQSALLANISVPAGTYNSLSTTFSNPRMTIMNESAQTITVGGESCAPMQICHLHPTLNQMNVTVNSAPFPITLAASSPVALDMHFDVNTSVQGDLSVTPSVSLTQIPFPAGGNGQHIRILGSVTAVSSPTFMLQDVFGGSPATITTDNNTVFEFGASCAANNFSCIMTGQLLKVRVNVMMDGTLEATEVRLIQLQGLPAFAGTIVSVNAPMNQFQIALSFEEGPFGGDGGELEGDGSISVTVQLSNTTTFSIDSDQLTLPAGLTFANAQDLVVGQNVEFQPMLPLTITGTPPNISVTVGASSLELEPSQITATVSAVNAQASPPNFVFGTLPMLFTAAGINQIQVDTVMGTEFEDLAGLSALSTGQKVSVAGLLFNTASQPTAVAVEVRVHEGDD